MFAPEERRFMLNVKDNNDFIKTCTVTSMGAIFSTKFHPVYLCVIARGNKNDKSGIRAHLTVAISARYAARHINLNISRFFRVMKNVQIGKARKLVSSDMNFNDKPTQRPTNMSSIDFNLSTDIKWRLIIWQTRAILSENLALKLNNEIIIEAAAEPIWLFMLQFN